MHHHYACVCTHLYIYGCITYVYTNVHVCTCVVCCEQTKHACIYIWLNIICIHQCESSNTCITQIHECVHVYTCTYVYMCTHVHMCTHNTCIHQYTCVCTCVVCCRDTERRYMYEYWIHICMNMIQDFYLCIWMHPYSYIYLCNVHAYIYRICVPACVYVYG